MPPVRPSKAVTITNPLVLYRALLATKRIEPDPAQHRLAIHLQKLYHRLKDYEPAIDFNYRIAQINRLANQSTDGIINAESQQQRNASPQKKGILGSLLQGPDEKAEATALTRKLTEPESAIELQSPRGLLLYGEVGTGKSLLVDLLADCLPNRKKRRWHFNNFMLETFTRIEQLRRTRSESGRDGSKPDGHSMLSLARDMISTSPILFLDEFQIPDRAASKILSNLLTSFFHLGGVLIATSNRMPEELANAAGIEFTPPPRSSIGVLGDRWKLWGKGRQEAPSQSMFAGKGDLAAFLDVLRARCEVWDMEGGKDWRRQEAENEFVYNEAVVSDSEPVQEHLDGLEPMAAGNLGLGYEQSVRTKPQSEEVTEKAFKTRSSTPKNYFIRPMSHGEPEELDQQWKMSELSSILSPSSPIIPNLNADIPWQSTTLTVYARPLLVPRHHNGVTKWTFDELCATNLGPADYITLASTYHTFILTAVPILTLLHKNEARRFITCLDALYEARCKLLLSAETGPDDLFFPETESKPESPQPSPENENDSTNAVYAETFAEIYQDSTSPFRPNIASYHDPSSSSSSSPPPSTPPSPSNYHPSASSPTYPSSHFPGSTRSILADEDSDFGPVLGRHAPPRSSPQPTTPSAPHPDFTVTTPYTGADERFAYKRASSRLWELCSARWWARGAAAVPNADAEEGHVSPGWWRPLPPEARSWEKSTTSTNINPRVSTSTSSLDLSASMSASVSSTSSSANNNAPVPAGRTPQGDPSAADGLSDASSPSTSPFRTSAEPPPRFSFVHAWGMMRWGAKAGVWGKGLEGLGERRRGGGDSEGGGEGGQGASGGESNGKKRGG